VFNVYYYITEPTVFFVDMPLTNWCDKVRLYSYVCS